jgi:hypothetical protein
MNHIEYLKSQYRSLYQQREQTPVTNAVRRFDLTVQLERIFEELLEHGVSADTIRDWQKSEPSE